MYLGCFDWFVLHHIFSERASRGVRESKHTTGCKKRSARKDMTERNEEDDDETKNARNARNNSFASSFLSHLNLPERILSDRVARRTQARLIARKETVADAEADELGLNEIAKRTTRGKTTTKEKEKKECSRCENELNLISSLKRDLSQANAKSRRLSKMVSTRDETIEDLKKRAVTLNREKAKLLCEDRVKAIEIGTKEVERKEQEKVLVIPKGLADADAAARETWLKLLRSEDASFVRSRERFGREKTRSR